MVLMNAYCTHRAPPELVFPHKLNARRDRSDPELASHLNGFAGFVTDRGRRKMTATLFHVLGHLGRVQHHLSLDVEDADLDAFAGWAEEANAILFLPDGTVRDPAGAVLVEPGGGKPDARAVIPFPPDARTRKAATDERLRKLGVRVPESLPPVVAEVEVLLRDAQDVVARAEALFAVALRGESLAAGEPLSRQELEAKLPAGFRALTEKELRFFAAKKASKQEILDATWRYEALLVLAWALGRVEELPFPKAICDVPGLARVMTKRRTDARLIATSDVLGALDLHYRLHWAVRQAQLDKKAPPAGLEGGVVAERHHALNWLVRFDDAGWDEVDTPT